MFHLLSRNEKDVNEPWIIHMRSEANAAPNSHGITNQISTTRYSLLTWLPKSLWEQFRRIANAYFLLISILMIIGTYATYLFTTPLSAWATVAVLTFVLLATSMKDGYEDLLRARSDKEDNFKHETVVIFDSQGNKEFVSKHRKDIQAGDIIYLHGHRSVPADMLLLHTSLHRDGNQCYVETANIDGETNLKLKEAPAEVKPFITGDEPNVEIFRGRVEFEPANKSIYTFSGALHLDKLENPIALGPMHILLRGSMFANTDWAYGVAIYTGQETKLQMNSRHAPSKLSKIELYANNAIKIIFLANIVLVTMATASIYFLGFNNYHSKLPYVYPPGTSRTSILPLYVEYFIVFFLLFNNLIPISLYITLELVNLGQGFFVHADREMYDPELDCSCVVRSSNLCQELGLVSNIFSDKTGTLTRNEMKFVRFLVNGVGYDVLSGKRDTVQYKETTPEDAELTIGDLAKRGYSGDGVVKDNENGHAASMYDFLRCLAICHTVILEKNGVYRAESPDELALVEGIVRFDCKMIERSTTSIRVELLGEPLEFRVLAVNAFNSDRKRMSVLVQGSHSKKYLLLCKGADSTMLPLCNIPAQELEVVEKSLYDLSCFGLRTLCIAHKPIPSSEAEDWLKRHKQATSSLTDREKLLEALGAEIELNMTLLGVTAVEDRLQDEVPEVIAELAKAGIVLWMLTGDKQETAINIGNSCNLLTRNTRTVFLSNVKNEDEYEFKLQEIVDDIDANFVPGSGYRVRDTVVELALIMDGPSFNFFNEKDKKMAANLLKVGQSCRSVIACRLTPRQKQLLVKIVKRLTVPRATCLAIGDGANDVSMIREADVGVGIFGKEGKQAANNADFAIGQFKFLKRLLLVHGRWNYIRQSRTFLYSAHKNMVITLTLFWYSYFCANSGTSTYESWVYSSFNIVLGLPIVFFGVMDRDVSANTALLHPQMYSTGRKNVYLNMFAILGWIVNAWIYATIICLVYYYALEPSYQSYGLFEFGTSVFTAMAMGLQAKVAFLHHQWAWPQITVMFVSIVAMFIFFEILSASNNYSTSGYYFVTDFLYQDALFWWFAVFTTPLMLLLLDMFCHLIYLFFFPTEEMKYREIDLHEEAMLKKNSGFSDQKV